MGYLLTGRPAVPGLPLAACIMPAYAMPSLTDGAKQGKKVGLAGAKTRLR